MKEAVPVHIFHKSKPIKLLFSTHNWTAISQQRGEHLMLMIRHQLLSLAIDRIPAINPSDSAR
jgi:hypothetical protein